MAIIRTYCEPMTKVEERLTIVGTVPAGQTYRAGMVVDASTLDNNLYGNYSVYTGVAPADVKTTKLAIIINGGNFETLPDNRRPDGQPDYTQYVYNEGETFTAIFLDDHLRFQISTDCITGTPTIGKYLNATNGQTGLTAGDNIASTDCFVVEAEKFFRIGGNGGLNGIATYVVSASTHNVIA